MFFNLCRTSSYALIAAAGLFLGSLSGAVYAADLGGDCCADLEERVAELEATTARKGNRKVSVELSGQINKALLSWNDGKTSDAYVVDNNYSSTRFRIRGVGQLAPGWKAGFYMEYEFRDSSTNLVDQTSQSNRGIENALRIRQENVFIESEKFGRVTLGNQNAATKDVTLITLGGGLTDPDLLIGTAFRIRDTNGTVQALGNGNVAQATRLNWGNVAGSFDTARLQAVRYDTPSIYGFIVSASWGENDFWDVAVRYQKEWNSIRVSGGIGYAYYSDPGRFPTSINGNADQVFVNTNLPATGPNTKSEVLSGAFSALHTPTGLYGTFAAGTRSWVGPVPGGTAFDKDASFYYFQGGITKRFFDVGATTFYGEYGNYDNFAVGAGYTIAPVVGSGANRVVSSNVDRYGFGFTQVFDGAALELFANYYHYSADIDFRNAANTATVKASSDDFDAVLSGARIKF